jgi:phospholipid/cholesterol/gamma-HCH transport system substrate-binding protein
MMTPTWMPRAIAGVVALALGAWFVPPMLEDDMIEASVVFDEVGDLVEQGHVRFADVPVGTIGEIALTEDHRAEVTIHVERDATVPSNATAVLRMTSLLGERYVDLVADPDDGVPVEDGAVLPGAFESDIELLVGAGSDLLGAVTADHVARTIEVGARTLDGRGDLLGELVEDLGDYLSELEQGRDEVTRFIDSGERLTSTLAPDAELNAAAMEDLADLTGVLAEEEERLVGALDELSGTAEVGARIISDNRQSLDDLLARLSRFSAEVLRIDQALENLLLWLPRHNIHVPGGVVGEMSQVLNDFTICGYNDEPDNPANSCDPPNPGQPNDPAPGYVVDECILYHVNCDGYPDGATPYRGDVEEQRTTPEERQRKVDQAQDSVDHRREPRRPAPEGLR